MSNVIAFPDRQAVLENSPEPEGPFVSGQARCLKCRTEWECVAPAGTPIFECPSCGAMAGTFVNAMLANDENWKCRCGCMTFGVSKKADVYCSLCGLTQVFPNDLS